MSILLTDTRHHALVAAVIREAHQTVDAGDGRVSRSVVQRVMYFLKAAGVPMSYQFDWNWHAAFSDELATALDWLVADQVIADTSPEPNRFADYAPAAEMDELLARDRKGLAAEMPRIRAVLGALAPLRQERLDLLYRLDYHYRWVRAERGSAPWKPRALARLRQLTQEPFSDDELGRLYDALQEFGVFGA